MQRIDPAGLSDALGRFGEHLYSRVEKTIRDYDMRRMMEQGVLLGLSGGADSVMLLCLLLEYRRRNALDFSIVAVHVNHGIRGAEADSDEEFCRQLCLDLKVEFIGVKVDVPEIAKEYGIGLEEAARNVRYSHFKDIIHGRNDLSVIAVAHNMSDNAETVLFNVMRGSGARGASGIRPARDNIIRPLIEVSKSEIISVMKDAQIPYVTDSTNLLVDYSRNYLRHEVMPALVRLTADPEKMLSRFASNLRSDDDYISSVAREFISTHNEIKNTNLAGLHYSVFVRVLAFMAGYDAGYPSTSVSKDIYSLLSKENFTYSLYGDLRFICERGVCSVGRFSEFEDYRIDVNDTVTPVAPFCADFILTKDKSYLNVYKNSIQVNLSSAIISGRLYLRPKKDGDTVYYGGMTHKLKKLFCDRKIPLSKRKTLPILCDDRGVVWVPGFGVRDDDLPVEKRCDLYAIMVMKEDK